MDGLFNREFASGLGWQAIGEDVFLRRIRSRRRCYLAEVSILLLMLLRLLLLVLLLLCKPLSGMEGLVFVLLIWVDIVRLSGGAAG